MQVIKIRKKGEEKQGQDIDSKLVMKHRLEKEIAQWKRAKAAQKAMPRAEVINKLEALFAGGGRAG